MNIREFVGVPFLVLLMACSASGSAAAPSPATAPTVDRQELAAPGVEAAIRAYYNNLKQYNLEAMKATMTPDFALIYRGQQIDGSEFLRRHREEERVRGPTASRPERMKYELVDFSTEVTPEVAIATFRETNPAGNDYLNLFVLKRSGNQWLIYRLFHMLVQPAENP